MDCIATNRNHMDKHIKNEILDDKKRTSPKKMLVKGGIIVYRFIHQFLYKISSTC